MHTSLSQQLLKRALQGVVVVLVVGLIAFSMFRYIGDPVLSLVNVNFTTPEEIEELRKSMGLDLPFYAQYFRYLSRIFLHGDFGTSYQYKIAVIDVLKVRVSATLELALFAFVLSLVIGALIGIYTAIHSDGILSHMFNATGAIGISIPSFIIGLFLIYVFTVNIPILPTFGRGQTVMIGPWESNIFSPKGFSHLILPALTLSVYEISFVQRVVNSEMQAVLGTEFIRYAKLRGLSGKVIYFRHCLKNILPQVINIMILQLGKLIAFSSITETIFQWPGLGLLFIQSLQRADIPVLSSYLIFIAILFVVLNLLADILQSILDPRISQGVSE